MPARGQACGHCLILTEVADAPEGTPLAAGLGAFLAAWRASRGGPPGDVPLPPRSLLPLLAREWEGPVPAAGGSHFAAFRCLFRCLFPGAWHCLTVPRPAGRHGDAQHVLSCRTRVRRDLLARFWATGTAAGRFVSGQMESDGGRHASRGRESLLRLAVSRMQVPVGRERGQPTGGRMASVWLSGMGACYLDWERAVPLDGDALALAGESVTAKGDARRHARLALGDWLMERV
jgi:hypothetical protein